MKNDLSHNGSRLRVQVPPHPACHACGKTVDLQHDDALVEVLDTVSPQNKGAIVWHQTCYDQFLDEGEEG